MAEKRDIRTRSIVDAAARVFAAKGYDNATLADIADAAGVSRGLPHYYFKDKEDLAVKAIEAHTSEMINSAVSMLDAKSVEELADSMVEAFNYILQEDAAFYTFLFEMWSAGRRSKRIGNMFRESQDRVVNTLVEKLESSHSQFHAQNTREQIEILSRLIIALTDGVAFQLVIRPELVRREYAIWSPFRSMLLALLADQMHEKK
jgi:AcrR family transcriptional regulator